MYIYQYNNRRLEVIKLNWFDSNNLFILIKNIYFILGILYRQIIFMNVYLRINQFNDCEILCYYSIFMII